MNSTVRALRGATTLDVDTAEAMAERVGELLAALYERNGLTHDDVISAWFTTTTDLHASYPAVGARAFGMVEVPLMGAQEQDVVGGLERCVRVMLHVRTGRPRAELRHVYQHGATALRPDLAAE